jgi:outer membrane receptor protein involved in Fe transport
MRNMNSRCRLGVRERCPRPATAGVAAAVLCALYGSHPAVADQPSAAGGTLEEVVVTATRRQQALEAVPYSISAISEEQLDAAGITDIASLAAHVPGLSMYDYGARFAGAVTPIIRGINATGSPPRGFRTFEQAPVGTYIGNSPVEGYFLLDDVARVEVLRGPQGTLYGAGALGGALRFIPNAPQLNAVAASIEASATNTDHSTGTGYSVEGMVNVPLGDTVALRVSGKYAYDPGWIKAFGLLDRTNTGVYGVPLLATPGDIVNSAPSTTPAATGTISERWGAGQAWPGNRTTSSTRKPLPC